MAILEINSNVGIVPADVRYSPTPNMTRQSEHQPAQNHTATQLPSIDIIANLAESYPKGTAAYDLAIEGFRTFFMGSSMNIGTDLEHLPTERQTIALEARRRVLARQFENLRIRDYREPDDDRMRQRRPKRQTLHSDPDRALAQITTRASILGRQAIAEVTRTMIDVEKDRGTILLPQQTPRVRRRILAGATR